MGQSQTIGTLTSDGHSSRQAQNLNRLDTAGYAQQSRVLFETPIFSPRLTFLHKPASLTWQLRYESFPSRAVELSNAAMVKQAMF